MTDKQIAIGRRAVACKDWRWMSGMATAEGHRVVLVDNDVLWMVYNEEGKCKPGCVEDFVPDLTDPATLGCLLALVREAWRYPSAHPMPWGHTKFRPEPIGWSMMLGADDTLPNATLSAPTEAEALIAALEAAPTT